MKPASKALGLHGVFKPGKVRKHLIADSAFKRLQVDAPGACWLDANEHHLGLALRTGGALNCSEWNNGRQALRLGHDASLEQAGAQHSLSPVMPRRRSGDCPSMRLQGSQKRVNSRIFGRKVGSSPYSGPAGSPWRVLLAFQIGMRLCSCTSPRSRKLGSAHSMRVQRSAMRKCPTKGRLRRRI